MMRRWFRFALLVPVVFAPVLAASIIPDPDWIGGFFDGADGDEIAALVFDRSEAIAVPQLVPPAPVGGVLVASAPAPVARAATPRPHPSRAPPVTA